ncbi:MAG: response regulator transcription factor [Dehalococcoidales bacterium]|nr:response regulator transcription factor [Dehalococcoidales bacterium]
MIETKTETVNLLVVEEQEIYREIFASTLSKNGDVNILRISDVGESGSINRAVGSLNPDVLLLSIKKLDEEIIEELGRIKETAPKMGIIILIVNYNPQDIELLRKLALCGGSGMALFLKQSLDKVQQLSRMITAVKQGQVILDPPLANYMFAGQPDCPFLKQLTARELEILSLLSQGYTNQAIAETLYIDIKTVEHHLNSMYSKLKADPGYNTKHLRVSAARLYLEKMGTIYQKEETKVLAGVR